MHYIGLVGFAFPQKKLENQKRFLLISSFINKIIFFYIFILDRVKVNAHYVVSDLFIKTIKLTKCVN